uniref:Uncharacterized protein n=1 Tax=Nannochloropsis gaditana (strain CCMP526) TaxID=1093141 RepID=I2CRL9_NANGC
MPPSPPSPRSRIQGDAYEDAGLRSSHGVTKGAARALLRMGVITRREYAQLLAASALVKQPPSSYLSGLPLSASARVALSSPRAPRREPPRRVCPISLEPVCAEATGSHSFCFSTLPAEGEGGGQEGGSDKERACVVWYDVRALCSYLIATGNFVEPTSRRPIGAKDVEVLASKLLQLGEKEMEEKLCSTFASSARATQWREQMDLLEGLDRCVGEVVTEMLRLVEGRSAATDGEFRLCMLLPHFDHFFGQLIQADEAYAMQCIDQYIRVLSGPPTHPTPDAHGLLPACLSVLREKQKALKGQVEKGKRKACQDQRQRREDGGRGGSGGAGSRGGWLSGWFGL